MPRLERSEQLVSNLLMLSAFAPQELLGGLAQWRQGNGSPKTGLLITIGTAGVRDYA
jgi:hypothetical protein